MIRVKCQLEVVRLNGKIQEKGWTGYDFVPTLLAMMPCPLKVPVEEDFARREEAGEWADFDTSKIVFEGNATQAGFYEQVKAYRHEDELPELIVSPGISSFFHSDFRKKFLERGVFADVTEGWRGHPRFGNLELVDPKGWYTVLCVNPLVMVADLTRLDGLPVPRSWTELLKPEWSRRVNMRGKNNKDFCETTLLTLRHVFGPEAVERFGESVKHGQHPAQMAKQAGAGNPDAPAVSIMPYFYAKTIPRKDKIAIIWPEEGAIASPVFLLAKAASQERLKPLTDYLTGPKVSALYENAWFPALNPSVESKLPPEAKLMWMGWDLVWHEDIGPVKLDTEERFMRGYRKGRDL